MAKRIDPEEATEAEVIALMEAQEESAELNSDSDVGEEPIEEEDSEEEEPVEEETEEETEDSEAEEEPEEEDEESEEDGDDSAVNWDEVDPKARKEFEKISAEAQKWKSDHAKIQSAWTKQSKSQKDQERNHEELRQHSQALQKWNDFFEQNPQIREVLEREIKKLNDPFGADEDVPDYLKEDPAFQYLQKKFAPYVKNLENKVRSFEGRIGAGDTEKAEAKNRAYLDGQLQKAAGRFKSMFGKEATQDEIRQVLQYMVDKKYYDDGELAAEVVFRSQYQKALSQKRGTSLKEKAKKYPSRNKTLNPATRTQGQKDAATPEEAIAMALADQGVS